MGWRSVTHQTPHWKKEVSRNVQFACALHKVPQLGSKFALGFSSRKAVKHQSDHAALTHIRQCRIIVNVHSVLETPIFTRRADALLTREERAALIGALAVNPLAGELVPGLGGIRKLRFAAGGKGKRSAFRVI
jgi:hypothetical protein